ncbi:MAG: tRNA 2-thiouridine(34) synthase MnmA [Bacilli bacterium]|nr:tRNA 2-thiouridine(34) synthase MnmA [Bacilli bacterium]
MTKVMVGLSGGVDSAVAAYLLKQQGYDVVAGFMRNWDAIANGDFLGNPTLNNDCCPQEADYEDAKKVAEKLGIKLYRIDFIKEYWDNVFSYFLSEYEKGRTPNPDIFCNKYIKFDSFLKFAKAQGCDLIATGHYAKRVDINGKAQLHKCFDQNKDQTYFLSQINNDQISSCLFPLADIDKTEVRRIAHELELNIADKKDSTGVCFIGERNFKEFLKNYIPANQGNIVDINSGDVVGIHDGVMYYTIGQRKGLGIGGIKGREPRSWFVCFKDVKNNILYVADDEEDKHLLSDRAIIRNINWIGEILHINETKHVGCKFRYRQKDQGVTLKFIDENSIELIYDEPYKAVTTGQAAVFYDGTQMVGGGIIDETYYQGIRTDILNK